jgi:hypothetical protein
MKAKVTGDEIFEVLTFRPDSETIDGLLHFIESFGEIKAIKRVRSLNHRRPDLGYYEFHVQPHVETP